MRPIKRAAFAGGAIVAVGAYLAAMHTFAQGPEYAPVSAPPPADRASVAKDKKHYTKTTQFHLPVKLDQRTRENVSELVLYAKAGQANWVKQESIPPSGEYFTHRVPQDGEYWFTVVMVDRTGKANPADVTQAPPSSKVVVDTLPPLLDVRPWISPEGELFLKCLILDVNPDLNSPRLNWKENGVERLLEAIPNHPGLFKVTPEMFAVPVRVTALDLCGNQVNLEVNIRELVAASATGAPLPRVSNVATTSAKMAPEVPPSVSLANVPSVPGAIAGELFAPPLVASTGVTEAPAIPGVPMYAGSPMIPGTTAPPANPSASPPVVGAPAVSSPLSGGIGPTEGAAKNAAPSNRQMVNSPQATIEYRIDQVGPSGVGKVEVYCTADAGANWQRLKEDTDRSSPADIELPGDGLFGIRLVLTNGNGFGGTAPQRGDAPSFWIEVDNTAPFVQFRPFTAPAGGGALDICWTATDKNLSPEPIALFYRTRNDGPWQVIARNLKNDGQFRWNLPSEVGSQFFLKVEAIDQVGNLARAETPTPIVLDMIEPRAVVVGVTGANMRAGNPQGN